MSVHYSWGEHRREHVDIVDAEGNRAGCLTLASYRTLCGRWDVESPTHEFPLDLHTLCRGRPAGVCPVCWHELRRSAIDVGGFTAEDLVKRCQHWIKPHPKAIPADEVAT